MKSEKGVTLTSLAIYIVIFTIILGIMNSVSLNFRENISEIQEPQKYITEFNKFSMFFVRDVKNNTKATITSQQIIFEDGTTYAYKENGIYRNGELITEYIRECEFIESTYKVNAVTKNLIGVNMIIGTESQQITRDVEFVLKYW